MNVISKWFNIGIVDNKISVVINTLNEEKNVELAIKSVKWANEIIVCDMYSDDKTIEIAKKMGAKIVFHKKEEYVELARNFAISKASSQWVLILDPDEEIPDGLAKRLQMIPDKMRQIDYVRIPRKNIIFGKWMRGAMWWPDLNVRFFKKGFVEWTAQIHRPPKTRGEGIDLPLEEGLAIIHHNYQSIWQFIERMNRYTQAEAKELKKQGYKLKWQDLLYKPLNEFLSRFFANKGYQNGVHGLALSLLQGFSFLIVYLKVWENSSFEEVALNLNDLKLEKEKMGYQINYWMREVLLSKNPFKRFLSKFKV